MYPIMIIGYYRYITFELISWFTLVAKVPSSRLQLVGKLRSPRLRCRQVTLHETPDGQPKLQRSTPTVQAYSNGFSPKLLCSLKIKNIYQRPTKQIHTLSAVVVSSSGSSSAGPGQRREGRRALRPLLLRVFGQTFQVRLWADLGMEN